MNDIRIGCGVKGMYKIQVLDHGRIVEDRPWAKNMILNQGLDYAFAGYNCIPNLFCYHCVGTGTTAVSSTQVGLDNEVKRTGTYLIGTGNTGLSISGGVATYRYTFDHSVEGVGGANYTEHGLSPSVTAGNNLFARSLISGGTVTVAEGQQLRVIYDIIVSITPAVQTVGTAGGIGWPVPPATNCDGVSVLLETAASIGTLSTYGSSGTYALLTFGGTSYCRMYAASSITLPSQIGSLASYSPISDSEIKYVADSYSTGSFTRNYIPSGYASASSFKSSSIAGFLLFNTTSGQQIAFKYNQNQTKANTHRLRYPSITVTWARA